MDVVKFNQRVKHGVLDFHPTIAYGFEDPDAAPYFKACGWAEDSKDEPAVVISFDELDIDSLTLWGDGERRGKFVMPERAAAQLREQHPHITDQWARDYVATFVPMHELIAQLEAEGHVNG